MISGELLLMMPFGCKLMIRRRRRRLLREIRNIEQTQETTRLRNAETTEMRDAAPRRAAMEMYEI